MIRKEAIPTYLAAGASYEQIMDGSPKELEPFILANNIRRKMVDEEMWMMGHYAYSAMFCAIDRFFNGRKARSKYIKEPMLKQSESNEIEMSEEEKQRQRELFVANFEIIGANFRLNKNKGKEAQD